MRRAALLGPGALLLAAASLCACGPPPVPPVGEIEIGTIDLRRHGDARWVGITEGQDAELSPGAQGGYHIWLRYRTHGLTGRVHISRIADRVSGRRERVLTTDSFIMIPPGGAAQWEPEDPIPNFMCPTPIGVNVIGESIELLVRAEIEGGAPPVEGRATVTARCPPEGDPQRAYCLQICSG